MRGKTLIPTQYPSFENMASKKVFLGNKNDDRISSLPNGVLSHILSFLPTKYSVRTSVLSTRWKKLFTFVPNLDFEHNSFTITKNSNSNTITSFIHFVNFVFIFYNVSRMNKFRFHFYKFGNPPEHFPLFSWMSSAVNRHVKEIDICVSFCVPIMLPLDLFSCKTLTVLNLQGRFNVKLPRSVFLPCLRTCLFLNVCFDDESARRLFRSCPVLKTLDLTDCCIGEGGEVFDISVPSLERLIFHESGEILQLVLNVPNLRYFEYAGPAWIEFLGLESLKSVVDAHICFDPDAYTICGVIVELVYSVAHVQQLYLNCDVIQDFIDSGYALPTFNNVTRIRFGPITCSLLRLLLDLLDNAPRLEFISFEGSGDEEDEEDESNYLLPEHVPACVSLNLKEVDFIYFTELDYECELIKYFLKYAQNLRMMKIQTRVSWNEQFEISSAACQIVFESSDLG